MQKVFICINQFFMKTATKQITFTVIFDIEILCITIRQPAHKFSNTSFFQFLNNQMKMIWHKNKTYKLNNFSVYNISDNFLYGYPATLTKLLSQSRRVVEKNIALKDAK